MNNFIFELPLPECDIHLSRKISKINNYIGELLQKISKGKLLEVETFVIVERTSAYSMYFRVLSDGVLDRKKEKILSSDHRKAADEIKNEINEWTNFPTEDIYTNFFLVRPGTLDESYAIFIAIYTSEYTQYPLLKYYYDALMYNLHGIFDEKWDFKLPPIDFVIKNCVDSIYADLMNNGMYLLDFFYITKLSSMTYEGEPCKNKIICIPETGNFSVEFFTPIKVSFEGIRAIRKLMAMTDKNLALIVCLDNCNKNNIVGFNAVGLGNVNDFLKFPRYEIIGHSKWELNVNEELYLSYDNGQYFISKDAVISKDELETKIKNTFNEGANIGNLIEMIIEAQKQSHGTTIIIEKNVEKELNRLRKLNRVYQIRPVDLCSNPSLIQNLTAVDGAIMCDCQGICYGIGAIVDGECIIPGNTERGSRYNSIRNYVALRANEKNVDEVLAVVVSEDKTVDIFTTKDIELIINDD